MELTKQDSKMIQGLSILAMLCLHLFCRSHQGLYTPLLYINGIPLSYYLGQLSDFCVMGFAFCSGYAHFSLSKTDCRFFHNRILALFRLLCSYWLIILVFSLVSILAGQASFMPGNVKTILGNVFLYNISYNGAWWYMYAYVILVLLSPLLKKAVEQVHPVVILTASFLVYFGAYYLRFEVSNNGKLLNMLGAVGTTLFEYLLGMLFAHTLVFSFLQRFWKHISKAFRILLTILLFLGMLLSHTLILPSLFVAPFTGIVLITLFHFWQKPLLIQRFFLFMGNHSTNIWLTHMFFYLVLFKNLVYYAKYPLLIYLFMLIITVAISLLLHLAEDPIHRLIGSRDLKEDA